MTIKTNYFDGGTLLPSDLINEKMSLLTDGVYGVGDFLASQHSPANLSVDIAAGEAQKIGYYIKSDAVANPAITANVSGFNRIDIIVLNVDTTGKVTTIIAVAGTPSSSPTAPLPAASQLLLQEVFVGNNVSVINTANITDKRVDVDLFSGKLANITSIIPIKFNYMTGTATTGPMLSYGLPSKGVWLVGVTVYGQNTDLNHVAGGLWVVKYDGGGTNQILSAELLGTVHKVGYALTLSVGAPGTTGIIVISFTQTNSTLAKFNLILSKVGGI